MWKENLKLIIFTKKLNYVAFSFFFLSSKQKPSVLTTFVSLLRNQMAMSISCIQFEQTTAIKKKERKKKSN